MMQRTDYFIKFAAVEDSAQIAELERQNFSSPWSEKQIEDEITKNNCVFLAAYNNEGVIGYISGQLIVDEFYISNIAVQSQHRNIGIASALIERLLICLNEKKCVFATLEVRISNDNARRLYEKCSFELVGIRKSFYSKPTEDACIYTYYFNKEGE